MNWFYDNTFPPVLARAAAVIAGVENHASIHLLDYYKRDPGDLVWIPEVAQWEGGWTVISGDTRLYRTPQNRAAVVAAGLTVFLMWPGFPSLNRNEQAWKYLKVFPFIAKRAAKAKSGRFYNVKTNGEIAEV